MPTIEDDGKYLTCRAENIAISDSALEDKWRLDVQYQPVVNLRMGETLNPDDIKEGDDVYFECIVRANPKVYKLAWFKDVSNTLSRVYHDTRRKHSHDIFAVLLYTHAVLLFRLCKFNFFISLSDNSLRFA